AEPGQAVGGGRRDQQGEADGRESDQQAVAEIFQAARLGEQPLEVGERELARQHGRGRDKNLLGGLERSADHPGERERREDDEERAQEDPGQPLRTATRSTAPHWYPSRRQKRK